MLRIIAIIGILLTLLIAYSSCVISGRCSIKEEQDNKDNQ